MDGLDTSVGSTPSGEQGASPAPAAASGGNVEGQGDGNGMPAGQPPAADPSQSASAPAESDAAVTPEQQTPAQPEGETPAVPQLRAHVQTLETDLNGWKGLGAFEQVKSDVGLVNTLFGEQPAQFWEQVQNQSEDAVVAALDAAFDRWPQFMIKTAQTRGLIPQADATQTPQFQSAQASQAELAVLDPRYHEMYNHLSPQDRYEIQMEEDPAKQSQMLETRLKAFNYDQMLARHDQQLNEQKEQRRQEQTAKLGQDFRDAVWSGIKQQLADKLKPTGNPQIDDKLSEVVWTWAQTATAQDATAQTVLGQLYQAIDGLETRKAMSLAAPVQAHAARLISEFLTGLAPIFDGYHKFLQSQRGNGDNRVEAPIPGGTDPRQQPNNGQLPKGAGEFDPENLRNYSRQIFG